MGVVCGWSHLLKYLIIENSIMVKNKRIKIQELTCDFFKINLKYNSVLELHKLNSVNNVSNSLGSGLKG